MGASRRMRLVLGMLVAFGAISSFGIGMATAGAAAGGCAFECENDCGAGECEEFETVGCGCVWLCSDSSGGGIVCG